MKPTDESRILSGDDTPDFAALIASVLKQTDDQFESRTPMTPGKDLTFLTETRFDCGVGDFDRPRLGAVEWAERSTNGDARQGWWKTAGRSNHDSWPRLPRTSRLNQTAAGRVALG